MVLAMYGPFMCYKGAAV